jgi:preprotein translocase subunit SecA
MILDVVRKIFGTKHTREIKRLTPLVSAIGELEPKMKKLSDEDFKTRTAEYRQKIENGAKVDDFLVPAFAMCREAGRRALGMRHYDVQLIGGIALHEGKIAEMKTGEGKTLVATLPCYLNALEGKGVHLVTVNDYLAKRDAEWMGKIYNFLGLSVGVIGHGQNNAQKKKAYAADITYGQNNEYGFDYLRDNMKFSIYDYAQRELNYAIVDEVDSILVDEARTPLIISGPGETASEKYIKINAVIPKLRKDEHYELDEKARQVTLTEDGMAEAQVLLGRAGLLESENLYDPVNLHTLHILGQSLRAHALYKRDVHYMVTPDQKVMIVDEFTGRTLPGRRWSDGLHQAVEAKEHVPIQDENITLATISFQNLFRLYKKLAGMTGTADTEAQEFHKIYKLDVLVIPTNKQIRRTDYEDVVYKTEREKFNALVKEIEERNVKGQPVLVGTTSVEKSEVVARLLARKNIQVNVLNAKHHEGEAFVVAQAGKKGAVTVATNMAGRGTDIILGGNPEMLARLEVMRRHAEELAKAKAAREATEGEEGEAKPPPPLAFDVDAAIAEAIPRYEAQCKTEKEEVLEAGGLMIIGTERHESRRIDNQLRGRSGRQGDPGESRFYLSLEDDLMRIFAGERTQRMMDRLGMEDDVPIEHRWVTKAVANAQRKVEERNFDIRKNLLEYDDVMNQQRKSVYALRRQVLMGQYRTMPTEEEAKKGATPKTVVDTPDDKLREVAKPILAQMIKHHAAPLPAENVTPEELRAYRDEIQKKKIGDFTSLRYLPLERDVYMWFGCQLPLKKFADDPEGAYDFLLEEAALSLTEQRERLLDLVEDLVSVMVQEHCPPNEHHEDWKLEELASKYREQFGIDATGIERISDQDELAAKLYGDAEKVLLRKEEEFGSESFLRAFRNFYMQEIDRQWIEHLQTMDSLRDGIGLRGYAERDPKREYKRQGYELFLEMTRNVKGNVGNAMFRAQRVTEEDLQRQEEQRRRVAEERLRAMETTHPSASRAATSRPGAPPRPGAPRPMGPAPSQPGQPVAAAPAIVNRKQRRRAAAKGTAPAKGASPAKGAPAKGAPVAPPAAEAATVKRDKPKVGRNDPCWCGSGKKYKNCHLREDQASATGPSESAS